MILTSARKGPEAWGITHKIRKPRLAPVKWVYLPGSTSRSTRSLAGISRYWLWGSCSKYSLSVCSICIQAFDKMSFRRRPGTVPWWFYAACLTFSRFFLKKIMKGFEGKVGFWYGSLFANELPYIRHGQKIFCQSPNNPRNGPVTYQSWGCRLLLMGLCYGWVSIGRVDLTWNRTLLTSSTNIPCTESVIMRGLSILIHYPYQKVNTKWAQPWRCTDRPCY